MPHPENGTSSQPGPPPVGFVRGGPVGTMTFGISALRARIWGISGPTER
jgi:hypothetical protein